MASEDTSGITKQPITLLQKHQIVNNLTAFSVYNQNKYTDKWDYIEYFANIKCKMLMMIDSWYRKTDIETDVQIIDG